MLSNLRKAGSDLIIDVLQTRITLLYERFALTASVSLTLLVNFVEKRFCEHRLLSTRYHFKIFHKICKIKTQTS